MGRRPKSSFSRRKRGNRRAYLRHLSIFAGKRTSTQPGRDYYDADRTKSTRTIFRLSGGRFIFCFSFCRASCGCIMHCKTFFIVRDCIWFRCIFWRYRWIVSHQTYSLSVANDGLMFFSWATYLTVLLYLFYISLSTFFNSLNKVQNHTSDNQIDENEPPRRKKRVAN